MAYSLLTNGREAVTNGNRRFAIKAVLAVAVVLASVGSQADTFDVTVAGRT